MGKYKTISVKIPAELKEKLDKYGISPSKLIRETLEKEVLKREAEEINRELSKMKDILKRFSLDEVVESIREDREGR